MEYSRPMELKKKKKSESVPYRTTDVWESWSLVEMNTDYLAFIFKVVGPASDSRLGFA